MSQQYKDHSCIVFQSNIISILPYCMHIILDSYRGPLGVAPEGRQTLTLTLGHVRRLGAVGAAALMVVDDLSLLVAHGLHAAHQLAAQAGTTAHGAFLLVDDAPTGGRLNKINYMANQTIMEEKANPEVNMKRLQAHSLYTAMKL